MGKAGIEGRPEVVQAIDALDRELGCEPAENADAIGDVDARVIEVRGIAAKSSVLRRHQIKLHEAVATTIPIVPKGSGIETRFHFDEGEDD